MLKVRRSRIYTRWFGWYSRRQFRRHFHSLRVSMPPELQEMDLDTPVIFYCNHAYWWDGFWSQLCTELFFRQNLFIIIENTQLTRHRFFTRLGAFSIDRSNPRSALQTLDYAAEQLAGVSERQNALWIFPQGLIEHVDKRPLLFYRGTEGIAERLLRTKGALYLVSLVTRIEYLDDQEPELFLSFRSPQLLRRNDHLKRGELTRSMQRMTEDHLDELHHRIMNRDLEGFTVAVRGAESVNRRVEHVRRMFGLERRHK